MNALLIATLLLSETAAAPIDVPMTPTGKWTVEYGDSECILSRNYGAASNLTIVGFKPAPLGGSLQVVVLSPGVSAEFRTGKATLTLQPSQKAIDSTFDAYGFDKAHQTLTTVSTDDDVAADLEKATSVKIDFAKGGSRTVAVPGMKGALAALQTCQVDLLKSWGVDPTERERYAEPPKKAYTIGNPVNWITSDDYPYSALNAGQQGATSVLWKIGTDGRVSDCRVVKSSKVPDLDKATCKAITMRGRYPPPLDKQGKPMELHAMRRVIWRLPG